MRKACSRLLEQWPILIEYFTKFLPNQKSFRPHLKSPRYKRIVEFVANPLSEASLSFIVFVAQAFEQFLVEFQSNDPMIPYLYESLVILLRSHMIKFMKTSVVSRFPNDLDDGKQLAKIDVKKEHRDISKIEIGTKAKVILHNENIPENEKTAWRQKVLRFYQESSKYLQTNLLFHNQLLKDAAYLHPSKRTDPRSVNAISRMCLTLLQCIGVHSKWSSIMRTRKIPVTKSEINGVCTNW